MKKFYKIEFYKISIIQKKRHASVVNNIYFQLYILQLYTSIMH